ncbi:hypothetical protein BH23BAC4_BH23BAC4_16280 [soil metagenome]
MREIEKVVTAMEEHVIEKEMQIIETEKAIREKEMQMNETKMQMRDLEERSSRSLICISVSLTHISYIPTSIYGLTIVA